MFAKFSQSIEHSPPPAVVEPIQRRMIEIELQLLQNLQHPLGCQQIQ